VSRWIKNQSGRRKLKHKSFDVVQLKLRFYEALRRRIELAADRSGRSMNAEIVHRLEQSFHKDEQAEFAESVAAVALEKYWDRLTVKFIDCGSEPSN
jgi:hypothetical protein